MIIPEYNQRVIANEAQSTLSQITEPKALSDTSGLKEQANKFTKNLGVAGDAYLDMKKQRDFGIVNQFMNDFEVAKTNKINELKKQYKGANSENIVGEFQKWQNEYFHDRVGQTTNVPNGTLYLENKEQVDEVKKQLTSDMGTSLNSLSNYAASSLNKYAEEQADGRIFQLTERIAKENNFQNIEDLSNQLAYHIGQKYPNSPKEYTEMQAKKLLNASYASNLDRVALEDPERALLFLRDKDLPFANRMSADSISKAKTNAIAKLIDRESSEIATLRANGQNVDYSINQDYYEAIRPFIKEYGEEKFKSEVEESAVKKQASYEKVIQDNRNSVLNQATSDISSLIEASSSPEANDNDREQISDILAEKTNELSRTRDGARLVRIFKDTNDEFNLINQAKNNVKLGIRRANFNIDPKVRERYYQDLDFVNEQRQKALDEVPMVDNILNRIQKGEYTNALDIIPEDMSATSKFEIMRAISNNQKYRNLEREATRAKYDVKSYTQKMFQNVFNAKPNDSLALYRMYVPYLKDEIIKYHKETGKYPSAEESSDLGRMASFAMDRNNAGLSELRQLALTIPEVKNKLTKGTSSYTTQELMEKLVDKMGSGSLDDIEDYEKEEVAKLLLNDTIGAAYLYLKGCLDD